MEQKLLKTSVKATAQELSWKFWLWLGTVFITLMIVAGLTSAWAVRHVLVAPNKRFTENQTKMIIWIASLPDNVKSAARELEQTISGDPLEQLMNRKEVETPAWVRRFPAPEDQGYLLFSGVDAKAKQVVVKLIRIADGAEMARWQPDNSYIYNQITDKRWLPKGSRFNLRARHPILLNDGDIIFSTDSSLVRQGNCSPKPLWVLDEVAHHSNELDETGDAIWAPSISTDGFPGNMWLKNHIRGDALGHFSLDGRLLERRSFANILMSNGLGPLLMGTSGFASNDDPIHLNQVSVAHSDSAFWKRGDLLISSRHLSTIFLYRPSTNKILWHQTGPWMNQHSVNFVNDHQISVFSNNVVFGPALKDRSFLTLNDINRVYIFDFNNNKASQPYEKLLSSARPVTLTEGRAQILHDGGLFVEETNYGRLLRFSKDALLWTLINDYDARRIGLLSWSRYLSAEEVRAPLKALAEKDCQNSNKAR
jgi:hypothetical protein